VSGVAVVVSSVANLVHFYSHNDFVPSEVCAPVLLLALTGLAACPAAVLGWYGAMAGNACRLYAVRELTLAMTYLRISPVDSLQNAIVVRYTGVFSVRISVQRTAILNDLFTVFLRIFRQMTDKQYLRTGHEHFLSEPLYLI
jgi:hypothetical protein